MAVIGSILHGAYGDYYEQAVALRYYKYRNPSDRVILFFATQSRLNELSVLDFSFADGIYLADALVDVMVDRFVQFNVFDRELNQDILSKLPESVLRKMDLKNNIISWQVVREVWKKKPDLCDIPLSQSGRERLPLCMAENGVDGTTFTDNYTVGFLWRPRAVIGSSRSVLLPRLFEKMGAPKDSLLETKSEVFDFFARKQGALVIIAGMGVKTTAENSERTDCKYSEQKLDIPAERSVYLKGLNWALELEIMRRCDFCLMMPSGFTEVLWLKRGGRVQLLDCPPMYLAKVLWNRMPFFGLASPRELFFQLRQPHTLDRTLRHLRGILPLRK